MTTDKTKINDLIKEIQKLIDVSTREKEIWSKRLSVLYEQIKRLRNFRDYQEHPLLLNAYLTLQSFFYSSSQHKEDFTEENWIEKLEKEIELVKEELKDYLPEETLKVSPENTEEIIKKKE